MKNRFFLLLTIIVLLFSCRNLDRNENHKSEEIDGNIESKNENKKYDLDKLNDALSGIYIVNIVNINLDSSESHENVVFGNKYDKTNETSYEEQIYGPILYENERLTGEIVRYHKNGKLKYLAKCIDGYIEGVVKTYFIDGNIESEMNFKRGKANGLLILYNPRHKILKKALYEYGKIRELQTFFENGQLAYKIGYDETGRRSGELISYYENGRIESSGNYPFGERPHSFYRDSTELGYRSHGLFQEFFQDGSLKYKANYVNGLPDGPVISYHNPKQIFYKEFWSKGKIVGKIIRYFENGKIEQIGYFNNKGQETGEWKEFYNDGNIRLVIKFDKGEIIEQHFYKPLKNNDNNISNVEDLRSILPGAETRF
jgi:antitoxin component YwqK of YwqJK toxin-antitoxin module